MKAAASHRVGTAGGNKETRAGHKGRAGTSGPAGSFRL